MEFKRVKGKERGKSVKTIEEESEEMREGIMTLRSMKWIRNIGGVEVRRCKSVKL